MESRPGPLARRPLSLWHVATDAMYLGYNTNGLAHHNPFDAVRLLARLGYQGVALTLDHGPLNPLAAGFDDSLEAMRSLLVREHMRSVVETGARYLLDPWTKHEPTLVTADRGGRSRRIDFLKLAVDAAARLESDCVSLWSGVVHDRSTEPEAWSRLVDGLREVVGYAAARGVVIGFEPEPGMLVDTMERFSRLRQEISHDCFRLTLDVGHLHCLGETPITEQIERWSGELVNVHLEDMRLGVHEHLMFGEGEINFPPVLSALAESKYAGGVFVELSRHSHNGPAAADQALTFLRNCWPQ